MRLELNSASYRPVQRDQLGERSSGNAAHVRPNMPNARLMEGNKAKAMLMAVRYLSIANRGPRRHQTPQLCS
jgi:hypothetical protein